MDCHRCLHKYNYEQSLFPVKSKQFKSTNNIFRAATKTVSEICHQKVKCTKHKATKTARKLYAKINLQFEKTCQIPLAEALIGVPELQLQQKKSKAKKKEGINMVKRLVLIQELKVRSSNFKKEEAYLIECWSLCLEAKIPLPLHVLRVKDVNKDALIRTQIKFLKNNDHAETTSVDMLEEETVSSVQHQVASECTPDTVSDEDSCTSDAGHGDQDSEKAHYTLISPPEEDVEEPMAVDTLLDNTTGM